jgi:hypothetical protein
MSSLAGALCAELFGRTRPVVMPEIQSTFAVVWIAYELLPVCVDDDRALGAALRSLLPSYRGPAKRLFRGTHAGECRPFGFSWSTDLERALEFAQRSLERQGPRGRAVVFETVAPADTIICAVSEAVGGSEHEIRGRRPAARCCEGSAQVCELEELSR